MHSSRVVMQPSSKTSYVVLGEDAGPSKLAAIKKNNLKTLDEDQFLELIATRVPDESSLDEKTKKKMEKEKEAIRDVAREMERREKRAAKESAKTGRSVADSAHRSRTYPKLHARQLNTRCLVATLDGSICATDTKGGLWQQRSSREAAAVVA